MSRFVVCAAAMLGVAVFIPATSVACAKKDGILKTGQTIEVTGIVRRVGNEPWVETVVSDINDADWHIEQSGEGTLKNLVHKTVTVRGKLKLSDIILANNQKIGIRRELSKIQLLTVED